MSFTDEQVKKLSARIRRSHVRERQIDGKTFHYIEGWHVVSEANRIFGFDAWDRETVSSQCVWQRNGERAAAAYLTRVRVTVRAGDRVIVREGLGSGEAFASTAGQAHERASKAAETDATKRALSTFGNSFGLSLYGGRGAAVPVSDEPSSIGSAAARVVRAVAKTMRETAKNEPSNAANAAPAYREAEAPARDVPNQPEDVRFSDAGWVATRGANPFRRGPGPAETNAAAEPAPRSADDAAEQDGVEEHAPPDSETRSDEQAAGEQHSIPARPALATVSHAPGTRVALLPVHLPPASEPPPLAGRIDKSVLAIPEPRRLRDKHHLKSVARQPCLVCGRAPSQAHHLRIAQPRALGRKVSDEFTVPLCALHHHDLHMKGNEAEWWWGHNIEPLPIAEKLWRASRIGVDLDQAGENSAAE